MFFPIYKLTPIKMKKYLRIAFLALLTLNLIFGYLHYRHSRSLRGGDANVIRNLGRIVSLMQTIRREYVDPGKLDSGELLDNAMVGMTKGLDEHSAYFRPKAARNINAALSGKMGGVGITTSNMDGRMIVVYVGRESPADNAGILQWDEIVAVDGENIQGMSYEEIIQSIRGEIGTPVKLTVRRGGPEKGENLSFNLVRSSISTPSVWNAQVIEGTSCAYFNIQSFIENTAEILEGDIKRLLEENPDIDSMILDLRGNGGGLMSCAVSICSFFLPEGQLVVTSRMQNAEGFTDTRLFEQSHYANGGFKVPDSIKLSVLMDRHSASASEITAGCLQDLKRAIIVGEQSYGKGSVQNLFDVGGGNMLKLTVARYYTPDKTRVIDGVGIKPDVKCKIRFRNDPEAYRRRLFGKIHPEHDRCVRAALEAMAK